jgi:S1-C subfamily serine protease
METANPLAELSERMAAAVETGGAWVVAVHGRPHVASSGLLWREGVVVTTDHTLKRDEDLSITLPDGCTVPATLAGRDRGTDLAVLRIEGGAGVAPRTADEASIKPGAFVLALGRPGANGVTASLGVVSAVSGPWRTWRGGQVERFIRPDVNIYVGFSGGALVDADGNLIGLNTSGLTRGTGVTLPVSTISRVAGEILNNGRVRRGFLGVGLHPVALPGGVKGLVVLSVEPGGAADKAGVLVGDVVLKLAAEAVEDTDAVQAHLGGENIGKPLRMEILRGGLPVQVEVVPGERK